MPWNFVFSQLGIVPAVKITFHVITECAHVCVCVCVCVCGCGNSLLFQIVFFPFLLRLPVFLPSFVFPFPAHSVMTLHICVDTVLGPEVTVVSRQAWFFAFSDLRVS